MTITPRTLTRAAGLSAVVGGLLFIVGIILMGAAWQMGLIPVSEVALKQAILLNGVAVQKNGMAFDIGRVLAAVQRQGGCAVVTADHGNAEQMIDPATGGPHTAHTTYPVELVVMDDRMRGKKLYEGGKLADVAPTLLHLLGLAKPAEMSGRSLIVE